MNVAVVLQDSLVAMNAWERIPPVLIEPVEIRKDRGSTA